MSVSREVITLGLEPGEVGAVPARTTIDYEVCESLKQKDNCDNKLNYYPGVSARSYKALKR